MFIVFFTRNLIYLSPSLYVTLGFDKSKSFAYIWVVDFFLIFKWRLIHIYVWFVFNLSLLVLWFSYYFLSANRIWIILYRAWWLNERYNSPPLALLFNMIVTMVVSSVQKFFSWFSFSIPILKSFVVTKIISSIWT